MPLAIVLVLISYLMGSICSAIIVCRVFNLPDPRKEGSKNPGATNVLRLAGKKYAALVLLVDILKGTIPVVLANALHASPGVVSLTVLAAVLGHMYPIFFNFKGGKGVATAIGALLGFHFIIGVMVAATWLLVVNFSRYSSLASIISITLSPLYALLVTHELTVFPPLLLVVILILFKHKNNITRLIDGSEPKVFIKENVIKDIMEDSELNRTSASESKLPLKEPTVKMNKSAPKKKIVATEDDHLAQKIKRPKAKASTPAKAKKKIETTDSVKTKPKTKPKAKNQPKSQPPKTKTKD